MGLKYGKRHVTRIIDIEANEDADSDSEVCVEVGDVGHVWMAQVFFAVKVELPVSDEICFECERREREREGGERKRERERD